MTALPLLTKLRAAAFLVAVSCLFGLSTSAAAYSAVAALPSNTRAALTVVWGRDSQEDANRVALETCRGEAIKRAFPVPNCRIIDWQARPGFGAVACTRLSACAVGYGPSQDAAVEAAVRTCRATAPKNQKPEETCALMDGYTWRDDKLPGGAGSAGERNEPQLRLGFTTNNFGRIDIRITSEDDRPITLTRLVINKRMNVATCDFNRNRLQRSVGDPPLAYGDFITVVANTADCGAPMHFLISTDKGDTVFTDR